MSRRRSINLSNDHGRIRLIPKSSRRYWRQSSKLRPTHTAYIYYTDAEEDAIGRFIRTNEGSMTDIVEHNIKIAISYRDEEAIDILRNQLTAPRSTYSTATNSDLTKGTADHSRYQDNHVHFTF